MRKRKSFYSRFCKGNPFVPVVVAVVVVAVVVVAVLVVVCFLVLVLVAVVVSVIMIIERGRMYCLKLPCRLLNHENTTLWVKWL